MKILEDTLMFNITIIIALILCIVTFVKWRYSYWKRNGLPQIDPVVPFGNAYKLFSQQASLGSMYEEFYQQMKSKHEVHGGFYFLFRPQYIPVDLEIIKGILARDFHHFVDRGLYYNEKGDPLGTHLFTMEGQKWKNLRVKLTPTFTSGKMKMMFPRVLNACEELVAVLDQTNGEDVEMKDLLARLTTDIIGTCAFGIECNSLRDPNAEFRKHGKIIFQRNIWERLAVLMTFFIPGLMNFFSFKTVRKEVADFFMGVIKQTVSYREQHKIIRNDFIHLLLQIKNSGKLDHDEKTLGNDEETLTLEEIAAQCLVFFIAGFETSSTTMSFCLYELAKNDIIQDKLRNEVSAVLANHNNEITYDALFEMPYMDMVINESLRKYPPLPLLNRVCTKDYPVPNTDIVIERGTHVAISLQGIHHDPEYYPNPGVFDPERFTEENKRTRHPFAFLPFGEGPRICIGLRFGLMQTKAGLAVLLKNYKFSLGQKMPERLTVKPGSFTYAVIGGLWFTITKIE